MEKHRIFYQWRAERTLEDMVQDAWRFEQSKRK